MGMIQYVSMSKIQVIISRCLRARAFAERVKEICITKGFQEDDVEVIQVNFSGMQESESILMKFDLSYRCRLAYCPGCDQLADLRKGIQYLPALIIGGKVISHSSIPDRSRIEEILFKELNR